MPHSRGHLNPGDAEVTFDRFDLGLDRLVRHVWVVRWDIPAGEVRPQRVLTYPTHNIVIDPDDAALYGPSPAVQTRLLRGRSWAVGVLLRPAAAGILTVTPPRLLTGGRETLTGTPSAAIAEVMTSAEDRSGARAGLRIVLGDWLAPLESRIDPAGLLVNEICRIAEERDDVVRVDQLADLVGLSPRTLVRLTRTRIGVTPKWLIECRRLQHAATTLWSEPSTDLAALAADLGYADQAHFTRRYHEVLGETPEQTRKAARSDGRRVGRVGPD